MRSRTTVRDLRTRKVALGDQPLVMVTAYDAGASAADEAGVDIILVGDTLTMVVLGHEDTLPATIDIMARHTAAVARTHPGALVLGDLPWMSYHATTEDAVRNAATLIRAGADAVKLEGGAKRAPAIRAITAAEIPVCGHIGLTPQSVHAFGGFRVQGRAATAARSLVDEAQAPGRGRGVRPRARGRARSGRPDDHRGRAGADHRDRCRPALRRAGAGVARRARPRGSPGAPVRARLRAPGGRCGRRHPGVRPRRAVRNVPGVNRNRCRGRRGWG